MSYVIHILSFHLSLKTCLTVLLERHLTRPYLVYDCLDHIKGTPMTWIHAVCTRIAKILGMLHSGRRDFDYE